MSDIFVSYANRDRERILPLVRSLENAGWSVFWDRNIPTGRTWRQVIGAEIKAARCIVVAWSETSVESEWVHEEADLGKRKKILFPVLIDRVDPPLGFGSMQTADLTDWDGEASHAGFRRFIDDVAGVLGLSQSRGEEERSLIEAEAVHETGEKERSETGTRKETPILRSEPVILSKTDVPKTKFRSTPKVNLSEKSVKAMLKKHNFFCSEDDWSKEYCNTDGSGFENKFKKKKSGQVVYDEASGLMWQQSGSECVTYDEAKAYIDTLNRDQFAGYDDWRLPSLEEAMSLMEPAENNDDLFIDPVFDKEQATIWTSDWTSDTYGASSAWVVYFYGGYGYNYGRYILSSDYVRAVR